MSNEYIENTTIQEEVNINWNLYLIINLILLSGTIFFVHYILGLILIAVSVIYLTLGYKNYNKAKNAYQRYLIISPIAYIFIYVLYLVIFYYMDKLW